MHFANNKMVSTEGNAMTDSEQQVPDDLEQERDDLAPFGLSSGSHLPLASGLYELEIGNSRPGGKLRLICTLLPG